MWIFSELVVIAIVVVVTLSHGENIIIICLSVCLLFSKGRGVGGCLVCNRFI